jgi:hypothetical protein
MTYTDKALEDIRTMSAFWLAGECSAAQSPKSSDSPGALLLLEARDDLVSAIEEGKVTVSNLNDDGQLYDIVGGVRALEISLTHDLWAAWVDLGLYMVDDETGEGWLSRGDLNEISQDAVAQCLESLVYNLAQQWRAAWACPLCGDTGEPLLCNQDECSNPAGALVGMVRERQAELAEYDPDGANARADVPAEPLPIRTPGLAMAQAIGPDSEPLRAVYVSPLDGALGDLINSQQEGRMSATHTGPVDLPVSDPLLDLLNAHSPGEVTQGWQVRLDWLKADIQAEQARRKVFRRRVALVLLTVVAFAVVAGVVAYSV